MRANLKPHERMALTLLLHAGSDQVGVIDDEDKLAAALVFTDLAERGLCYAMRSTNGEGPIYFLTDAGKKALGRIT